MSYQVSSSISLLPPLKCLSAFWSIFRGFASDINRSNLWTRCSVLCGVLFLALWQKRKSQREFETFFLLPGWRGDMSSDIDFQFCNFFLSVFSLSRIFFYLFALKMFERRASSGGRKWTCFSPDFFFHQRRVFVVDIECSIEKKERRKKNWAIFSLNCVHVELAPLNLL